MKKLVFPGNLSKWPVMNASSCQLGKLYSHTVTVKYHFRVMQTNTKLF